MSIKIAGFQGDTTFDIGLAEGNTIENDDGWGVPEPDNAFILVDHTNLRCAPDSVRFRLDLDVAGFAAAAPVGGEIYDARMHDVTAIWDFGDGTLYTAPENVLEEWKNSGKGKGHFVKHMYTQPGTYYVTVALKENGTITERSAPKKIVVQPTADVYPTTRTVCFSTSGDFTGAPAGATQITASALATGDTNWLAIMDVNNPIRVLFRRGETFTVTASLDNTVGAGLMFGAFGDEEDPIPIFGTGSTISVAGTYTGVRPDFRMEDVHFQGNFDPTVRTPQKYFPKLYDVMALNIIGYSDVMLNRVKIRGYEATVQWGTTATYANDQVNLHLNDCDISDFGGQYTLFYDYRYHDKSSLGFTGCKIVQNPLAPDDSSFAAIMRVEHVKQFYMAGCDLFHTCSAQPGVKLQETPYADGGIINVHSNTTEGGLHGFSVMNNDAGGLGRASVHNTIIDGNLHLGGQGTGSMTAFKATGVTYRNNVGIQPNVGYNAGPGIIDLTKFISIAANSNPFDADIVGAAPIKAYSNTFVMERAPVDNAGKEIAGTISTYFPNQAFTNIVEENNVTKTTEAQPHGSLSEVVMFTPRNIGHRSIGVGPGDFVLGSDVVDGADFAEIPYWEIYDGSTLTQASFASTEGNGSLTLPGVTVYYEGLGDFTVTYGATGITVTNNTGVTITSGSTIRFSFDLGGGAPLDTRWATPANAFREYKLLDDAPTLNSATTGNIAYDDLSAPGEVVRPSPAHPGAWQSIG